MTLISPRTLHLGREDVRRPKRSYFHSVTIAVPCCFFLLALIGGYSIISESRLFSPAAPPLLQSTSAAEDVPSPTISFTFFDYDAPKMPGADNRHTAPSTEQELSQISAMRREALANGDAGSGCAACVSGGAATSGAPASTVSDFEQEKAAIDAELRSLPNGTIVFNPPVEMTEGITYTFQVRVSRQKFSGVLRENLVGSGAVRTATLRVGAIMSVDVYGNGFTVKREGDDNSAVKTISAVDPFQEWTFDVTPTEYGPSRYLNMKASVRLKLPDRTTPYHDVIVLHRVIKVKVNPLYEIASLISDTSPWKWALGGFGGLLVSAGGYLGRRWLAQKSSRVAKQPDTATPGGS
ncbi:MAG TPA: hypothetical protein VKR31_01470 [Rhizomicrobium sp.]|nr:hypothetical protein [Rhizomicrobium sp.]